MKIKIPNDKYWFTWKEVEKIFGKTLADKMTKSEWLECITCKMNESGETEIPITDILNAYNDVRGINDFVFD